MPPLTWRLRPACRKQALRTYIESRSPGVGSRGTPTGTERKTALISFPYLDNFATASPCRVQSPCRMDLLAKAKTLGIQTEFTDGQGLHRVTGAAALKTILDALPPQAPRRLLVEPVVVRSGQPARSELSHSATLPVQWKIVAGDKIVATGEAADRAIVWPEKLPLGVHRLHLADAASLTEELPLIAAPQKAFAGDFARGCLLAVHPYGICSVRNWGMGDFTHLQGLIQLAHQLGASGLGLNPLHAPFPP